MHKKKITIEMELGSDFQLNHFNTLKQMLKAFEIAFYDPTYKQFKHKNNKLKITIDE